MSPVLSAELQNVYSPPPRTIPNRGVWAAAAHASVLKVTYSKGSPKLAHPSGLQKAACSTGIQETFRELPVAQR